ncbi:hypothetical protein NON20_16815 [Synechocystis sp. B12]|nr:hypothetical protein NON20_16815 [Synechocystis sp. B12]
MLRPRTIKEGSVGLFALLGLFIIGGIVLWLRGELLAIQAMKC